jgi:hypothetical protein
MLKATKHSEDGGERLKPKSAAVRLEPRDCRERKNLPSYLSQKRPVSSPIPPYPGRDLMVDTTIR